MDGNNPSTTGKSQEFLWSSLGWRSLSGQDKTYTCAFCKRGFSNAQALGGHMNIHRRDRAKLKLASSLDEECLLSLDIAASKDLIPSDHPVQVSSGNDSPRTESSTTPDGISVIKRPEESFQSIEGENDGKEELQQLPLFVDEKVRNIADGVKEEEMVQLAQDGSSQSQAEAVDLELRLGPEPLENSRKNAD